MIRLRPLLLIMGSIVIASLLIACGSNAEPAAPTEAATAIPQPPTAEPPQSDPLEPATAGDIPRITPQELKDRIDSGDEILIIDTRGEAVYDVRHLPGAVLAPDSYDDVPHDQEIILYCA